MQQRLFLAVPVRLYDYPAIRSSFEPFLQGRWREEDSLHATIAFLGEHRSADELLARIEGMSWDFEPSEFSHFEYFSRSRVFVATARNPGLQEIRNRLEKRLGLPHDLLHPHVTLMRVKSIVDPDEFTHQMVRFGDHPIGRLEPRFALYQSRLHPEGARYTILKEWSL